ncbi:DMT family transporter [Psychrosphaera sp. F3M07]|uniref:DMT family transporter n=1 Tax=Psychrosphaera sp. F3M07 TaxID=2841560 RepID=UPI001C0A27D9|nr:DMT family transporter [Psychrosphaera sp. F3M07]MBU2917927.1 DMT family transporter [Psychrosphaera sp. F3M07]
MNILYLLAFTAGAAIALQATMNAQLGVLLKNSMLGTSIAFLVAFIFTVSAMFSNSNQFPNIIDIKAVPTYLWFTGGMLSAFGVGVFYYLIPKIGVGSMMSFALAGQILFAMLISHFGWFNFPEKPINFEKLVGAALLIISVLLINLESGYAH